MSIRSNSSTGVSCTNPALAYPPTRLTTARSGAAGSPAAASTACAAPAGSPRSATTRTSPAAGSDPGRAFRSGTTTRQPASTNAVTTAPPSPPNPPVTKTLRYDHAPQASAPVPAGTLRRS